MPRDYNKEQVDFIDVMAWEKSAETIAEYVRKGHRLLVNGNVNTNVKNERKYTEILLRSFEFVETSFVFVHRHERNHIYKDFKVFSLKSR